MTLLDAWNGCEYGGAIIRPNGTRIEKWMSEKPDLAPSLSRWLIKNVTTFDMEDLMAGDWEYEQANS